jgi:hypothetical protein
LQLQTSFHVRPFQPHLAKEVKFTNLPNAIQTILRAHGLHKTSKRRQVEFGVSIDTTPIAKTLSHVMLMLTLIDAGAMDPRSKVPFFLQGKS